MTKPEIDLHTEVPISDLKIDRSPEVQAKFAEAFHTPDHHNPANLRLPEPKGPPPEVTIADFDKLDLRVGTITAAERIPRKDRVLKLEVSFGDFSRVIVAGIAENFQPEDVIGKQSLFVVNLTPRKIGDIESHGMILATKFKVDGETKASMALLHPTFPVPAGAKYG